MRRLTLGLVVALGLARSAYAAPCCGPITPDGERLAHFLDDTGVDHLWQAGQRVNWETGEPIQVGKQTSTHCSAFAAAVAEQLGVYILRPPQHPQDLLANAQMGWLRRDGGVPYGWRSLPDPTAAQAAANRGELVVEAFENPNLAQPGHIAIVRPSLQSAEALARGGPRETQAGATNAFNISTAHGFSHHRGAWEPGGSGGIRYFAHVIDWSKIP
ncbi:MAG TPA: hypothetical protein VK726_23500 [Acetobacteraceae bacterium]|jgi:hypothetical protein|nr:hypothetical protein [Acetobacteraceae bacterium]